MQKMNIRKLNYLKIHEEFFSWRHMFEKLKSRTFEIDFAALCHPRIDNSDPRTERCVYP